MIYLDYNATCPLKPAALMAMQEALAHTGNASSLHGPGRQARAMIEKARLQIAALVDTEAARVIFTGGGTEANNLVVRGWRGPVLLAATEHDSIRAAAPDSAVTLPVSADGLLDLGALEAALAVNSGALLAVMLVNNETGIIQPIAAITALARRYGVVVHADAVQAAGKMPLDCAVLGVASLSLSAHKIGGPQGVGALVLAQDMVLEPLLRGGGQEKRRRAGTENVAGIAGFGAAAALADEDIARQPVLRSWRDAFEAEITAHAPDAVIAGAASPRVAGTSCVLMPGVKSETQLMSFDLAGIAVSSGAACSSGKLAPSHVLQAMGFGASDAVSALRLSLGWRSAPEDLQVAAAAWRKLYDQTRR